MREIASFRTKIKDIGSKVFEMDAEVEEMTRDRRNNILVHGLPVQVNQVELLMNDQHSECISLPSSSLGSLGK